MRCTAPRVGSESEFLSARTHVRTRLHACFPLYTVSRVQYFFTSGRKFRIEVRRETAYPSWIPDLFKHKYAINVAIKIQPDASKSANWRRLFLNNCRENFICNCDFSKKKRKKKIHVNARFKIPSRIASNRD